MGSNFGSVVKVSRVAVRVSCAYVGGFYVVGAPMRHRRRQVPDELSWLKWQPTDQWPGQGVTLEDHPVIPREQARIDGGGKPYVVEPESTGNSSRVVRVRRVELDGGPRLGVVVGRSWLEEGSMSPSGFDEGAQWDGHRRIPVWWVALDQEGLGYPPIVAVMEEDYDAA